MADYSHEQISLLIKCFWRGIWPQFPFYRPLFIYFSQNYFQKEKKSSRGKELQNSSHSRSTKEGCVARGVEQEWVWEKEERNRRAANTQGPMESLDLSANAKRTTKALEVGRHGLTSAKTFFWVTTWTEVGGLGLWARRRVEKLSGLPSVLSRKTRGKRRMKLTLAGSTAKFSSVYPLV